MTKLPTILLMIASTLLASCATSKTMTDEFMRDERYKPRPMRKVLYTNHPNGDDSYSQGWQDGCHTFTGIMGEGSMRAMDTVVDAQRLTNDKLYLRGYQDASTFCTFVLDWDIQ